MTSIVYRTAAQGAYLSEVGVTCLKVLYRAGENEEHSEW
jgi:hypothetical protein